MIERFSEDIDIIMDWRVLGYELNEPYIDRNRTKQDQFNKNMNANTEVFLQSSFMPALEKDISSLLHSDFSLYIDDIDPQTICFVYPKVFTESSILPVIRIEIGALAAWTALQDAVIAPYAAQQYPNAFELPSSHILTVSPERTFWEKTTILHKESFRTNGNTPARYSRHYYDLYCMGNSPTKDKAFSDAALLMKVARFKDRFYPSRNAHYELAKLGTLRLMPPDNCLGILADDYAHMKNMIFGTYPSFEDILSYLDKLQSEINSLQ